MLSSLPARLIYWHRTPASQACLLRLLWIVNIELKENHTCKFFFGHKTSSSTAFLLFQGQKEVDKDVDTEHRWKWEIQQRQDHCAVCKGNLEDKRMPLALSTQRNARRPALLHKSMQKKFIRVSICFCDIMLLSFCCFLLIYLCNVIIN